MREPIFNDAPAVAEALEALAADEADRAAKYHMSIAAKLLRAFQAVAKDAARYRWLKEQWSTNHGSSVIEWRFHIGFTEVYDFEPLVDKAMAAAAAAASKPYCPTAPCEHSWDESKGPMPKSWECGCGTKVYRSYEDYADG